MALSGLCCLEKGLCILEREGLRAPSLVQVVRCAISPSSKLAATATQDHSIQIWELPSGRILHDLTVSLPPTMSEPLCRCGTDRGLDQAIA